jgi:2-polyprenyl-6-methoxyphenol hydroxylase-like FAD-dependent oxidoreductase
MRILIAGAGIAGPALAFWLARRGLRATVVERSPGLRVGGHAIDIRGAAVDVVDRMGLYARMHAARTHLQTLSIVRPGKSAIVVHIPRATAGSRDLELVRDDLVRILYEASERDADYIFGDSIAAIADAGPQARVTFASGTVRDYDVVVGADGQHSTTRDLVFGAESSFTHRIGAYLCIFSLSNDLGLADAALLYNEPGRGMAYYTMAGNERAKALMLFRSRAALDLRDEPLLKRTLTKHFRDAGWETPRLLEAMQRTPDFYFDEIAQIRMPRWSHGRTVLLGDAAHGPSPLSGQGTTLALVGALVLADALAAQPGDVTSAFDAYEARMRSFVAPNQAIASSGLQLLLPDSQLAIGVRNLALRAFPLLMRLGVGFGKKLERASRAIELPA